MHDSWKPFLKSEFEKPYFKELSAFLKTAYAEKTIFPPKSQVFSAFSTDLNQVKVVILGQDPYHTPGAATGLAFSVPKTAKIPPSLVNIYKEIDADLEILARDLKIMNPNLKLNPQTYRHHNQTGDLTSWQTQGVLLLNNVLTVEAHQPGSHRGKGWEIFTEATIKHLSSTKTHLVFLLWGRDAKSKRDLIDPENHLILEAAHPSPFSAHNGFFGCRHFTKTNTYLREHGRPEIIW